MNRDTPDRRAERIEMIERNHAAFLALRERLAADHPGEFVVMRDGEPVLFKATAADADREARQRFQDGRYSIQRCVAEPLEV